MMLRCGLWSEASGPYLPVPIICPSKDEGLIPVLAQTPVPSEPLLLLFVNEEHERGVVWLYNLDLGYQGVTATSW